MQDGSKNLVKIQSTEEAREKGRKGGIASGVSRRRKRSLREAADLYLSMEVRDTETWNAISEMGVDPEDIDNQMAMIVGLTRAAINGDAKAAKVIIDLIGEKPDAAAEKPVEPDPLSLSLMEEAERMELDGA